MRDRLEVLVARHLLARRHAQAEPVRECRFRSALAHCHALAMRRLIGGCKGAAEGACDECGITVDVVNASAQ